LIRCALIAAALFLGSAAHAEQACPAEVKLLLSPPSIQTVIASLGFEKRGAGRVYFFDTKSLDLLMQGVIVRVRQGVNSDLTVKVRLPAGGGEADGTRPPMQFACEIDRTRAGSSISYAVGRRFRGNAPETGKEIYGLLGASQIALLQEARAAIDWSRVVRIAEIDSTKWETNAQSPAGKLALEEWEWPSGRILELSAKAGPDAESSKYAELERLVRAKKLYLADTQDTKTRIVLESLAERR